MNEPSLDGFAVEQLIQGFRSPELPQLKPDQATIEAADRKVRHWTSEVAGTLKPGSDVHRSEMCRMFRETFSPYRPSVLDWPQLAPDALGRIVALPIWDIAVQTEGRARLRMAAYAGTISEPDVRDALALNAWEESRHKEVLSRMVAAYGIPLASEAPYTYPKDAEWAYLVTGYSECIDSFFAFGLFEVARRSGLFPPELVETFEPVIQEECRHILLFANWAAWHRAKLSWSRRIRFELKVAAVWAFLVWERLRLAQTLDADGKEHKQDNNFTINGAQSLSSVKVDLRELMALCLAENERRFSGYDPRLLRPETIPKIVGFALRFMRSEKTS
ncbi:ferritin-like domain-containing protein [Paraburkholderia sp. Tr-20389]|uniref:ferritin-like domain-containing protein n=1 Tax=Paraburkholderia sp. Tr-20389 TaxID=2703903 RepID=UPI00197F2186|nr:ferritin-like domain-containing protein [Paraburkholderia sp. Tr-20389]MBN3756486.1 ferritin-like domain-containing protein [Paraburkholderia sp. Tr-20389]